MATRKNDSIDIRSSRQPDQETDRASVQSALISALGRLRDEYSLMDAGDLKRRALLLKMGEMLVRLGDINGDGETNGGSVTSSEGRSAESDSIDLQALETLGAHYTNLNNYSSALRCYFHCIRRLEDGGDPTMLGITWMEIGTLYGEMGKLDRALESFRESIVCFRKADKYYLEVKAVVNIANILSVQGEYDVAVTSLLRCLMVFEELEEQEGIAEALAGIGNVYQRMGDVLSALSYMQQALTTLEPDENPALRGALLLNLGELYTMEGKHASALGAFGQGFDLAQRTGDERLMARLHEAASILHEELGDHALALHHHRRFVTLDREYRSGRGHDGVAEFEMRFEIDRVRAERDSYRRQAQELRQEVYAKTRELTSLNLNLVQKSEFLEEMRRQLGQIIGATQESSASIVRPLLDDLATAIKADDGWSSFEEWSNELHRDFMRKIADRFPSLTPTELKICALTRSDLSTKEIAALLFVSVRNVQNHRYRIRKKFGLDSESNLVSFLAGI